MDYVGVKTFDAAGRVNGERRFVGLFTAAAYSRSPRSDPAAAREGQAGRSSAPASPPRAIDGKALLHILETYPRDELFQISDDELYQIALGVLLLQERQRVAPVRAARPLRPLRLLPRLRAPRDHYNTDLRLKLGAILDDGVPRDRRPTSHGELDRVGAGAHALSSWRTRSPASIPSVDREELERRLAEAARRWDGRAARGADRGARRGRGLALAAALPRRFPGRLPRALRRRAPRCYDIERIERPSPTDAPARHEPLPAARRAAGARSASRSIGAAGRSPLSDVLPMLEHMGVKVVDEQPYDVEPRRRRSPVWMHDFGLVSADGSPARSMLDTLRERLRGRVRARLDGEVENDGFNRLVLRAGLTGREVDVLRAYCEVPAPGRLHLQPGVHARRRWRAIRRSPARWSSCSACASIRPSAGDDAAARSRQGRIEPALSTRWRTSTRTASCAASSTLIEATLRTNYFQRGADGAAASPTSRFKLDRSASRRPARCRGRCARSSSTRRGSRACTCAAARSRAAACAGRTARGLPHRGARPGEGAEGEERRDRAGRLQGRLRARSGCRRAATARRSRPRAIACYKTFMRGLLDITDNLARRRGRAAAGRACATTATIPIWWSPPTRARPPSPTSPTASPPSTASGSATPSPPAARPATTTRRWASPRAAPGRRSSATSASWATTSRPSTFTVRRRRRHVGRRVRQRHAAVAAHPAGRRLRPPPHLPRSRPRSGRELRRAPAAVRPAALVLGRLRHAR